jgi:phage terminase large subunit-like protein
VVRGESTIQFTSFDQDPTDFASGDFHIVLHDEPPPLAIWTENEARTMRVAGRMLLSMTWPDDPSIPVDWIFDEVYEPGMDPQRKDIEWVNLYTTDNPHLNQEAVAKQMQDWTDEMRRVRIYGQPIRFSNRVHPLFTDQTQHWCFTCGKTTIPEGTRRAIGHPRRVAVHACGGTNITAFNHVREFEVAERWPPLGRGPASEEAPHGPLGAWSTRRRPLGRRRILRRG